MHLSRKKPNSLLAIMMSLVMLVSLLPPSFIVQAEEVKKEVSKKVRNSVKGNQGYEIYPIPQSIVYNEGNLDLGSDVNVVFESGLDKATKNRLIEVLAIKNINHTVGKEIQEGKTNVIVGVNNSGEIVDKYFNTKGLDDEAHFTKNDSHIISVNDNVIAVLGKDTDSAFYGITSLKLIFKQLEGSKIRNLLIKDYSDGHWRGFVEGYYGIPWSNENRMSLMEFGGDFKMNTYIFAPKDDEYHSLKWREPYPAEKLTEIKEMVEVGAASKNKFIWTIHPFLHNAIQFDDEAKYQEDLATIITKFEQLYDVGVRQFGVLGDDAAEGEAADQVRLMNDLEEWRVSKGDVYSFIFVPKVYTKESAGGDVNNEYLNTIGQMPESTEIMWTGDVILGDVNNETFEFFEEAVGREAFMWLNWPVNDINNQRLLMGKGEMLDPSVTNFRGIVTNPMQEAQASKVALFAIADYSWNRAGFDMDKSWADSFKYIEPDAAEELHTFAKHMSDPTPNWHGLALEESEELAPYIEDFTKKLFAGKSIVKDSKFLLKEYRKIVDATNSFAQKSKNELLKTEIKGWVDSLRDEAESTIAYINAAVAFEQGNYDDAMKFYVQGGDEYTASRSHRVPAINNGQTRPEPGTKYLVPFIKDLSRLISEKFTQTINPDTNRLVLFPYTNMGPNLYWGHIQNIVDGGTDRLSTMWVRRGAKADDYVAVELSEVTDVNSIIFEHGEPGAGDSFNYVKFQYSMNGKKWKDIDGKEYGPHTQKIVIKDLNVKAKHVRVIPTGELKSNWISVRELSINKDDADHIKRDVYTNVDALAANKVDIFPSKATLADVKGITLAKGQYVGIKLNKIKELTTIIADVINNDKLTLEASINGVEWTEVTDLTKVTNACYVRVINNTKDAVTFDITNLEVQYSNNDVTFEVRPAAEVKFEAANLIDGKLNTAFKPGVNAPKSGSLVYKLSDRTDITKFTVIQSPSTISDAVVSVRTENGWSEVGTLAKSENVFSTAKSKNVFEIKIEWDGVAPTLNEIGLSSVKKKGK
ncbi:beta-N-acetylglucosaminidase domain-containing protein [Peribacillus butanolivorans]|uniref:beta-N-acetylglucosaminidase domain-containing protein n=1 Tax=Peribacillus butanolivorans TaxID=421767 RepID=UPI0025AA2B84|nr:beta-N-acetylglucosaminidase domain-containing protein [Peribacillus butanolivorans]